MWRRAALRAAVSVVLGAGLAVIGGSRLGAQPPVYIPAAPPPPLGEVLPRRPSPAAVWIPGHYRRGVGHYVWTHGFWALPPRPYHGWAPGQWTHTRRGWLWVDGHWR